MRLSSLITRTVFALVLLVPGTAMAALVVDFSNTPLFSEANILPGDAVERTVTVTNTGSETESVEFAFANIVDGPMSTVTELAVFSDSTIYADSTFALLFAETGMALGTLTPGNSRTYTFAAGMPATVGNTMQDQQFGFDIRIGFVGAEQITDVSRGAGGSGTQTLQLFNESVTQEAQFGGAFVTWNSNRSASTYLICGDVANGPFLLTPQAPLFGYEFSVAEAKTTATDHGLAVEVAPGEYECRPAGRVDTNDAFTVGDAVRFVLPGRIGEVAGVTTSLTEADIKELLTNIIERRPAGSVLGSGSKGAGSLTYEEFRADLDERAANQATTSQTTQTSQLEIESEPANVSQGQVDSNSPESNQVEEGTARNIIWLWPVLALLLGMIAFFAARLSKT